MGKNGGQGLGNIGMKALGHCAGIIALASTAWVTTTGARLGLRGEIGNWWSNGELGEHWGTGGAMENTGIAF